MKTKKPKIIVLQVIIKFSKFILSFKKLIRNVVHKRCPVKKPNTHTKSRDV